ncbi:MAG TPA: ABC transporter permease [Candidatus Avidehalobacter gallistercoris]|uniref:ABC transporter permease n=1 Tax=Candidatus Avidehalobacter gallistercoris TaxID=2840694 RepID=A0A9D1HJ03_9FIRM|nr:ABC transporter permease [Candidatus Avidehalobacter gallistercoris]
MLAKLLKYEFKATGRTLLPVYAVLIAMSLLVNLTVNHGNTFNNLDDSLLGILQMVIILAYGCIIGMVCIVTVLLLIQRFYKNLLRDEGYLMHTLPVKPWQNIMAKLVPAVLWSLLSLFMAMLSVMIIGMDLHAWAEFFRDFGYMLNRLFQEFGIHGLLFIFELLILVFASMANEILQVYVSLAVGHTANNRRILWSVAAYIGITIAFSFITMLLGNICNTLGIFQYFGNMFIGHNIAVVHYVMLVSIAFIMLVNTVFFGGANYILKRKLNLE